MKCPKYDSYVDKNLVCAFSKKPDLSRKDSDFCSRYFITVFEHHVAVEEALGTAAVDKSKISFFIWEAFNFTLLPDNSYSIMIWLWIQWRVYV